MPRLGKGDERFTPQKSYRMFRRTDRVTNGHTVQFRDPSYCSTTCIKVDQNSYRLDLWTADPFLGEIKQLLFWTHAANANNCIMLYSVTLPSANVCTVSTLAKNIWVVFDLNGWNIDHTCRRLSSSYKPWILLICFLTLKPSSA